MQKYRKSLLILILVSLIIRSLCAGYIELGNDEVYYRICALFPDWSYFDHPPMLAILIRILTLGDTESHEFGIRLLSIIIGTINTYLIFKIAGEGRKGFIAALLYTSSIYCTIILGIFILPDTPLSLFWLLTLWILSLILPKNVKSYYDHKKMLLTGLLIGLAMLSKYTGAYLWVATFIYILFYNKKWFSQWSLWVAGVISIICFLPILMWNIHYDWISFTFHGERITTGNNIQWLYFGREFLGEILYNNPINFILIFIMIIAILFRRIKLPNQAFWLIFSLPMIIIFLSISLTRATLPHWSAPAYFGLIILVSYYINKIYWIYIALTLTIIIIVLGCLQINYGIVRLDNNTDVTLLGKDDFSLDAYGWQQGSKKFKTIYDKDRQSAKIPKEFSLLQCDWADASHIDHYFGLPLHLSTKTFSSLIDTHYYEWITQKRGGIKQGDNFYFITTSRNFIDPYIKFQNEFEKIEIADTIKIYRDQKQVMNFFVFRMYNFIKK